MTIRTQRSATMAILAASVFAAIGCQRKIVTVSGSPPGAAVSQVQWSSGTGPTNSPRANGTTSTTLSRASSAAHDIREQLSVLCFNLDNQTDAKQFQALARHLRSDLSETPDFILCQEVVFGKPRKDFPGSSAQLLADELGYHWAATKRRTDFEGLAILSRFPMVHYDSLELGAQTSWLLFGYQRLSVMGEFESPDLGLVRVVNVHFTNWSYENHIRHQQLEETLRWVARREQAVPAALTIFGGDFNIAPENESFALLTDPRVVGTLRFASYNTKRASTSGLVGQMNRVDYIFISPEDGPVQDAREHLLWVNGLPPVEGILTYRPSDHFPLLHEYTIESEGTTAAVGGGRDRTAEPSPWRSESYR